MRFHLKFKSCLVKPTPSFCHLVSGYPVVSNNEDDISGDMRGGVKEMGEVPRQFFGHFDQGFSDTSHESYRVGKKHVWCTFVNAISLSRNKKLSPAPF